MKLVNINIYIYIWQRIVCWVARFGPTFLRRPGEHPGLSQPNVRPSSHGHGRPKPGRPKPRRPALADPAAGDPSSLGCFRYAYNRFLYISLLQEAFWIHTIDFFTFLYYRRHFGYIQSISLHFFTTGCIFGMHTIDFCIFLYYRRHFGYTYNRFLYISLLQDAFSVCIQSISVYFFTTGGILGIHTIDFCTFLYYRRHFG